MTMRQIEVDGLDAIAFKPQSSGPALVPVVAQEATTGAVLMLAWADRTALETSLATGAMHYWSRSRSRLWQKGEESGHVQTLEALYLDCDADAVLAVVRQNGPACHTGATTCWHADGDAGPHVAGVLGGLQRVLRSRRDQPVEGSYTNRLLADENLRLKKVGEESGEFLVAAARHDAAAATAEAADVVYHLMVALEGAGVPFDAVLRELEARRR